jgi:hypothetical protein
MDETSQRQLTVSDRKSEFVPVAGGETTTSAEAMLIAAYCSMWLFVFLAVLWTYRSQAALSRRLAEVEGALRGTAARDAAARGTAALPGDAEGGPGPSA